MVLYSTLIRGLQSLLKTNIKDIADKYFYLKTEHKINTKKAKHHLWFIAHWFIFFNFQK